MLGLALAAGAVLDVAAVEAAVEGAVDGLVEELVAGRNYRVLVVGGRMAAASERIPAHVIGDGEHTIADLIEIANRSPLRGEGHEKPLTKIVVTPIVAAHLLKKDIGPEQADAA